MTKTLSVTEAEQMISKLSTREFELVRLLTEGLTGKEICEQMKIQEGTFRSHKTRIKKKMGDRPMWGWPKVLLVAMPAEKLSHV